MTGTPLFFTLLCLDDRGCHAASTRIPVPNVSPLLPVLMPHLALEQQISHPSLAIPHGFLPSGGFMFPFSSCEAPAPSSLDTSAFSKKATLMFPGRMRYPTCHSFSSVTSLSTLSPLTGCRLHGARDHSH